MALDKFNPRLLLVDDEPWNLEVLSSYLHGLGYSIDRASRGEEALQKVSSDLPDLILLDIMMPGMDGIEVCRRLKSDEKTMAIPVVIVTSLDRKEDRLAAVEAGADDFITKPVDKAELLARTRSLLKLKRYHDERDGAYEDIRQISTFFSDVVRGFLPQSFSLQETYDSMFCTVLKDESLQLGRPTFAFIIPTASPGLSEVTIYGKRNESVFHKKAPVEDCRAVLQALRASGNRDVYSNDPPDEAPLRAIIRLSAPIENYVACHARDMLVVCMNYGRPVGSFDLQVIKDLAQHSMFLDTIAAQAKDNEDAFIYTIQALARAAEANDEDTGNHIIRVGEYSYQLARELGLSHKRCEEIRYSSVVHDVGKIHTPKALLLKTTPLTDDEWEEVKNHTKYGLRILGVSPRLEVARQVAISHHERWDGSGYPFGLKGDSIPFAGRIVALADSYDALRNKRVYKSAFDHATTIEIILKGDGRTMPEHFDPKMLEVFNRIATRFNEIYEEFCEERHEGYCIP